MSGLDVFLRLLKQAEEYDHEGFWLGPFNSESSDYYSWRLVRIHRFGWKSRSGAHAIETNMPPFFISKSYHYYLVQPLFIFSVRDMRGPEGEWRRVNDYPLDPRIINGFRRILGRKVGYFCWTVSRGISDALFCRYVSGWDREIIQELVIQQLL